MGLAFYGLLGLVALVYWPGLSGPLLFDDVANLGPLNDLDRVGALDLSAVLDNRPGGLAARPVSMATFYLNWVSTGGSVWHLKLTNLALHLLCGALVFWLAGRLLQQPVVALARYRWWIALWICALWLTAPLLVSTVLYIVQRMAQLSAAFMLVGLVCYVIGRQNVDERPLAGWLLIAASLIVCWPLAIASKENGAVLPLLLGAVEIFFFTASAPLTPARKWCRYVLTACVVLVAGVVLAKTLFDPQWLLAGYDKRDFTPGERLLTQARVLFDYLANALLLPGASPFGIFHDDFVKSRSLFDPLSTGLAMVAWAVIAVLCWHNRAKPLGLALFGLVFFLLGHLVEASVLPLELYFEHRNYLPSVGLFVGLGLFFATVAKRSLFMRAPRALWVVLATLPIIYAVLSANRVATWQTWDHMLLAAEQTHPRSRRVHAGLAVMHMQAGDLAAMSEHLDYASQLDRGRQDFGVAATYVLAYCVNDRAVPERAYARLERQTTLTDQPYDAHALSWLTSVVVRGDCPKLQHSRLAGAVHHAVASRAGPGPFSGNAALHVDAARLLGHAGDHRTALGHLEVAGALRPGWLEPRVLEAEYQLRMGMPERARAVIMQLEARPPHQLAPYLERLAVVIRALP